MRINIGRDYHKRRGSWDTKERDGICEIKKTCVCLRSVDLYLSKDVSLSYAQEDQFEDRDRV